MEPQIAYYIKRCTWLKVIETAYRDFDRMTLYRGKYVCGYPVEPCPHCGDSVMWYRESTWWWDIHDNIVMGWFCERCLHMWKPQTKFVRNQGMTRDEFRKQWGFDWFHEA